MALKTYTPDPTTGENMNPNAIYPRLTLGSGSNNYRTSTFWAYSKDYFNINYVQLAYNLQFKEVSMLKDMKLYLSGSNLLTVAKEKKMMDLNVGGWPNSRTYTIGLIANF